MPVEERPVVVLTMGDAAGIGPEVIVKALSSKSIVDICRPLLIGARSVISEQIESLGSSIKLNPVNRVDEVKGQSGTIDILDMGNLDRREVDTGRVCRACGKAAMEYVEAAAGMVLRGEARAMVTAPINKESTRLAGYRDVGHLEYLARVTGSTEYATMLVAGPLRVVHLTTHYPLREACTLVTKDRILARLKLIREAFGQWGMINPRIGVAALNPHGGESGLFGREEIEQIVPAVREAKETGIDARGPYPADTVFVRAIGGEFDVVLAMYHDQGHIPVKVHDFEKSISVALGLPFIRTSVDHGTAFDIAGRGVASPEGMEEAIREAVNLVKGRIS